MNYYCIYKQCLHCVAFKFSCHILIGTILTLGVVSQLIKANIITIHLKISSSQKSLLNM